MNASLTQTRPSFRDHRLDFFRGLCLLMIYVNHVPGTMFENFTSRNFGLSDAAEGFVFMSGCAVALAYGAKLENGLGLAAIYKGLTRSWQLYLVHLLTSVWAIAVVAGAVVFLGADEVLRDNSFSLLRDKPYPVIFGIATLGHQFGYVNILPLYTVLMLAAPFAVRLGQLAPLRLLAGSVTLWAVTALWQVNLPNYPQSGGWLFNPFAWQLVFTLGIVTGLALRQGKRVVPVQPWLVALALAWIVFCGFWVRHPALNQSMQGLIAHLSDSGVPSILVALDKTYVSVPRLLHFLALVYLLSVTGLVRTLASSDIASPVRVIGRHSLPVFAFSTVCAIVAQATKDVHPGGLGQDALLIAGGLVAQWAFAATLDYCRQPAATAPRAAASPALPVGIGSARP